MPARIAHTFCVLVVGSSAAFGGDCLPDLDGSGDVATPDLVNMLGQWGPCPIKNQCIGDINNDGVVDMLDMVFVLDCWGPCPCNPPGATELFD